MSGRFARENFNQAGYERELAAFRDALNRDRDQPRPIRIDDRSQRPSAPQRGGPRAFVVVCTSATFCPRDQGAEFLGDTVETVLQYYSHFIPDDTDRARKAMDQFTKVIMDASALNVPSRVTS